MGVSLTFLTPLGAALGLGVLVPLAALALVRRRAVQVRSALGVSSSGHALRLALAALLTAGLLLALAATQPVVLRSKAFTVRTDAEVFFVIDTTRSMLAQRSVGSPMRIARAKAAAGQLRAALGGVPVGIVSLTDRVLPHLFPSPDENVFQATLERAIGVEQPPPSGSFRTNATRLEALAGVRSLRFFSPAVRKRVLVVLTDGETVPVNRAKMRDLLRGTPAIDTVFVQLWHEDERVFSRGVPEPQYRPDPSSRAALDGLADSIDAAVFSEGQLGRAADRARTLLGEGPTVVEGRRRGAVPLAPYLSFAAFLPLALLLWRRDR